MFFRAKVQCPQCQEERCRPSRWHSSEEKAQHTGCTPYRCLDCSCRFLVPQETDRAGKSLLLGLLALFIIGIGVVGYLLMPSGRPAGGSTPGVSALYDPEIRKAAESGDAQAQFRLGDALFHDPSRNADNSNEAIRWLQLAAENGNTEAMIFLGRLSRTGVGILQNFSQASTWIQTAAARGDPEGMLELGRLYRDGVGVEKDLVKAYVWFNRASAARNLDAVREREAIARILTPEELKRAQRLSLEPHEERGKTGKMSPGRETHG